MRIALVVPGGVDRGGRERVIPVLLNLIERLARRHKVLLIALEQEPNASTYPLLGATVVNLGKPSGAGAPARWWHRFRQVLQALREQGGVDVIHAAWIIGPGTLAAAAGYWLKIPVVVSIFGGELVALPEIGYGGQRRLRGRLEASAILRSAAAVTANSDYALAACARQRPDAVSIPLGVDGEFFNIPVERTPGPQWRLLHVASLNHVKDQTTLLQALQLLRQASIDVHLDCIGADTLGGTIQRRAVELGLEQYVTFHGFLPLDKVVPFYRQSHILLQSSLHEAGGAAVMEAAAAGMPIIGTNVGLLADMAPQAAIAVPTKNPQALAREIFSLLADSKRRLSLGYAAREFANMHNADWTAAQFEAIYTRVAGGGNAD